MVSRWTCRRLAASRYVFDFMVYRSILFNSIFNLDFAAIDLLAHFDRERIPERVVHAKGAGAHGHFEVTHDQRNVTSNPFLSSVGKIANVTARFSTVGGESGSAGSLHPSSPP